ncbi:hypothetical protein HK26_06940 [Acetobacter okinawensis]|uniref:Uncharacterized protein n=1 Tax=Acetobacter okinawensis TaxID=1076594 RepID=A0A252BSE1_9PROT|nr:hypothetical protein HK26_06940 [Acetobacter okinawensis]
MVSTTGHNKGSRLETGLPASAAFTDNTPPDYACVLRKVNARVCLSPFLVVGRTPCVCMRSFFCFPPETEKGMC